MFGKNNEKINITEISMHIKFWLLMYMKMKFSGKKRNAETAVANVLLRLELRLEHSTKVEELWQRYSYSA